MIKLFIRLLSSITTQLSGTKIQPSINMQTLRERMLNETEKYINQHLD
jgi:hypothetical protein